MSFHVFVGYVHMFFGKMSVYILTYYYFEPIIIWVLYFFWYWAAWAVCVFRRLIPYQLLCCKYFLPFFCCYCSLSRILLFVTPWTTAHQASLSTTHSLSLLKLMSIELMMPSNHLIFCHPFLLLPSIFPSIRVFSNESVLCIRWLKYWSFSISPSNEYSGLISFRIDWFDLLAVQGTFKSLLQNHNSKALTLQHSAFFMAQLSHLCMTTGKIIALTERLLAKWCLCFLICCLSLS